MYKGNRKVLVKVLSLALAVGMSVSGLPVSTLAAEVSDAALLEEGSSRTEQVEDAEQVSEETVPAEVEEEAASETEEEVAKEEAAVEAEEIVTTEAEEIVTAEEEEIVPGEAEEEAAEEEKEILPEESLVVDVKDEVEETEVLAKEGDGWDANHEKYYVNGEPVCNEVMEIDGEYYGFDSEGYMERGCVFSIFDRAEERDIYYCATEDGPLVVNDWYYDHFGKYYFGEGGKAPQGFTEIDGILYFFEYNGLLFRSGVKYNGEDGRYYFINYSGVAEPIETTNGWYESDGEKYYLIDGELICNRVIEINGEYYGFDYDGRLYRGCDFYIFDDHALDDKYSYYRATEDGSLIVNDWYEDLFDGARYYYGEGGVAPSEELRNVGDTLYYFMYAGQALINDYYFDNETNTLYHADENGATTIVEAEDGWVKLADDKWAYFRDGAPVTRKVIQIGTQYYGFDSDGIMYSDESFGMPLYPDDPPVYYRAHQDGHLYVNEWAQENGGWYYYFDGGMAKSGLWRVGGVLYLFNWSGRMRTNTTYTDPDTGTLYVIGADGVARANSLKDGWLQVDGDYYYIQNGKYVKEKVIMIGGVYYGFGYSGIMYDDENFSIERPIWGDDDYEEYVYDDYRARKGGALYTNAWYAEEYDDVYVWNYYGADAKMVKGWKQIGGKWYYFDEYGEMVTGEREIGGTTYYFKDSGEMTTGWVLIDDFWYYLDVNGNKTKGWKLLGSWYYFDEEGKMVTGQQEIQGATYLFSEGGAMMTGWQIIDGDWYFFNAGGAMVKGNWQQSGNTWYYFDEDGKMVTGLQEISGTSYFFKDSGAMATGWQQIDGDWYFFNAGGAMVKGNWQQSGNTWYYFDGEGKMLTGLQEIGGKTYFFKDSGAMVTGWQQVGDDWYFFESSGAAACSKWVGNYYMDETGAMVTNDWVDNHRYYVGADGLWIPGYVESN